MTVLYGEMFIYQAKQRVQVDKLFAKMDILVIVIYGSPVLQSELRVFLIESFIISNKKTTTLKCYLPSMKQVRGK